MPAETLDRLVGYADLLARWNRRIRLVGQADAETVAGLHLADAFAYARALRTLSAEVAEEPWSLIDVGTGAGLPGLVLALLTDLRPITLCEVSEKRSSFLFEAERRLKTGVTIHHGPVEGLIALRRRFLHVVSRATFPPGEWIPLASSLGLPGGVLWALWTPEQEHQHTGPSPNRRFTYALADGRERRILAWLTPK